MKTPLIEADFLRPIEPQPFFLQPAEPAPIIAPMTVCIGAICDGGEAIVLGTDRLMSLGGALNFEGEERKILPLSPGCAVAATGNNEDAAFVEMRLRHTAELLATASVYPVAKRMLRLCERRRAELISNSITRPYLNISFAKFTAMCARKEKSTPLIDNVFNGLKEFKFHLKLLVAGIDDFGAQLYVVNNLGIANNSSSGFAAVGSGSESAIDALVTRHPISPSMKLSEAVYAVYAAKRAAEFVPGVGRATDIAVVRQGVKTRFLKRRQVRTLSEIHKRMQPRKLSEDDSSAIDGFFS